ncbi:MAG TPA: homoserine dehydrogenase [Acidimicrobiales bacterium]|nr:homoserine dehydrogenase [Acidimicrobiales bacterium]
MVTSSGAARSVRVAVLGCGNVGAALVGVLGRRTEELVVQSGARIELAGIAVRDPAKARPAEVPAGLVGADAEALVRDPGVDIVVELIGGLEPAGSLVRTALEGGKSVVTANKELLASAEGVALRALAAKRGVDLLYEAAVAGAIPLVRALRQSLTGERINRVMGIVNGTTNFILTRMSEDGAPYPDVLSEAQRLGLAEQDPTADVEGYDAAAKAAILAGVAFGYDVASDDVMRTGITEVRPADLAFAGRHGYVVKLLAIVERTGDDALSVRVHPALVPGSHPLASVRDAFNAVFIEGEAAGELMLYGQGAGGLPTASAVVGDLVDATRNRLAGTTAPAPERRPARLLPEDDLESAFFLSLDVEDQPGVLAAVSGVLGRHEVSIRSMEQDDLAGTARLLFVTHLAREGAMRTALEELGDLEPVHAVGNVVRLVGDGR